jgi:hypothetical protein
MTKIAPWNLAAVMAAILTTGAIGAGQVPSPDALPPLPSELQYRMVGGDLVLIDVHASVVVDILTNVLNQ